MYFKGGHNMNKLDNPGLVSAIDEYALFARGIILGNHNNKELFDLVEENGIELFGIWDDKYDGICIWNEETNKPQIYLNMEQSEERRLFTLAHELGHLFIDYKWMPNKKLENKNNKNVLSIKFRDKDKLSDTTDIRERVVNQFAGTFLMPKEEVEKVISDCGSSDDPESMILAVKKHFGVTYKAATNRLIMLERLYAK